MQADAGNGRPGVSSLPAAVLDGLPAATQAVRLMADQTNTNLASSGAALAAYCAAAQIQCKIAVVETAPAAKLKQMMVHGAKIERLA